VRTLIKALIERLVLFSFEASLSFLNNQGKIKGIKKKANESLGFFYTSFGNERPKLMIL